MRRCSVCGEAGHDKRYHAMSSRRRVRWLRDHPEQIERSRNPRAKRGPNVVRRSLVYESKRRKTYRSLVYKERRRPRTLWESVGRVVRGETKKRKGGDKKR